MALWTLGERLSPFPVGYVAHCVTPKKLVQTKRGHLWVLVAQLLFGLMSYEGFLVVLKCLQFFTVRSTESLEVRYGVVVPLLHIWGEECVSKEFPVFIVAGGAVTGFPRGGRATRKESKYQSRNFDSTRGYPGEDIAQ